MEKELTFRYAERKDTHLILQFIKELADYEKMLHEVVADESTLEEWIFDKQKAEVIFAIVDGKEIGFALFFHNFSTFLGRAGIYLEDLYVKQEYRGNGYGKAILKELASIAWSGNADDWNGGAWTGIDPVLIFIYHLVRSQCRIGPCIALPAIHLRSLQNRISIDLQQLDTEDWPLTDIEV